MNSKIVFVAGALALALGIGVLAGATFTPGALAQGPAPTATPVPGGAGGWSGGRGMMGGHGMWGSRVGGPAWGDQNAMDVVAQLLNMTQAQIAAERQAGKSLAQIAQDKGVTRDTLINTIVNAKVAVINQWVSDGRLTQAQADLMIQNIRTQVSQMVDRTDVGPADGRGGCWTDSGTATPPGNTPAPRGRSGMMGRSRS